MIPPACLLIAVFLVRLPDSEAVQARARTLPVEEMAQRSAVIGVATVQSSTVRREPGNGMICTDHTLKFTEVWKGEAREPFILVQAGGQIGSDKVAIAGEHFTFKPGESIVVFATPRIPEHFHIIGLRQGLYRVKVGPDPLVLRETERSAPVLPLRALKEQVYRTLGRPVETTPPSTERPADPLDPSIPPDTSSPPGTATSLTPRDRVPEDPPSRSSWTPWIVIAAVILIIIAAGLYRKFHVRPEA